MRALRRDVGRAPGRCCRTGVLAVLLWGIAIAAGADSGEPVRLTILHTNDLRGHLRPHDYFGQSRGGIARLATLLEELAVDGQPLIVDAGDALGPDPISQFDQGHLMAQLLDAAGYDALVPGNHDLNYGPDSLRARARGAGFRLLAANASYPEAIASPFESDAIIVRSGVRILVTGLLAPGITSVLHPARVRGLKVSEPGAALAQVLARHQRGTDYDLVVVLVHMPLLEVLELARSAPDVELFITGDTPVERVAGGSLHVLELTGGARIVSTPQRGAFLGRIVVDLRRLPGGQLRAFGVAADLIPVDEALPEHPAAARRVALAETAFRRSGQVQLAAIDGPIEDAPQFVCDLMRRSLRTEVAFINRGALRPVVLPSVVRHATIDSLVRFDDVVVEVEMTGEQLRRMWTAAQGRQQPGQRLLVSGYDPKSTSVNGLPLDNAERYRVATTGFLAGGGDGHLPVAPLAGTSGALYLSTMLSDYLRAHAAPQAALRRQLVVGAAWKTTAKLSNALSLTSVNRGAGRYRGVTSVQGVDALTWSTMWNSRVRRLSPRGSLVFDLKSAFGQIRHNGGFREASDRIDAEATYTWRRSGPEPFVSLLMTTVWTGPEVGEQPLTARASSGLQRGIGQHGSLRVGLGWEHDRVANRGQIGVEMTPEYKRTLPGGNSLNSSAKVFVGATETRKISAQQYNAIVIKIKDNLHVSADVNFFYFWDNAVERAALKSEAQVGLAYLFAGKRGARPRR